MPSLSTHTHIALKPSSLAELSALSMPAVVNTAAELVTSRSLREIAEQASSEELSFYKFQTERHAERVGLSETYSQDSLPSPRALLRAA